jgi:hypothetical protein
LKSSRNHGCRISEFTYLGYSAIAMENDKLRITLLPGKGTDVIQFLYKPLKVDFMWASQPGLQSSRAMKGVTPETAFLEFYPGGWQEILPNFGDACRYKGAALGLHDEVSLLPWACTIVENHPGCVSAVFEVRCVRTPFRIRKRLTLRGGCDLQIEEEVWNESSEEMDCTWGHHPAFGTPFLDETCRVVVPHCRVKTQEEYVSPNSRLEQGQDCEWPRVRGRKGETIDLSRVAPRATHSHDMAYLHGFEQGWYVLFHERLQLGFGMIWDSSVFKYLWFWQVYGGWHGYPWYGSSYNLGLEPCSSYPQSLTGAIAAGTQLKFAPGESLRTQLSAAVVTDLAQFLRGRSPAN